MTISNDRGDTPLHNAARCVTSFTAFCNLYVIHNVYFRWNHSSLVRELLLYGAMYSVTNNDNKTPLELTTVNMRMACIDRSDI